MPAAVVNLCFHGIGDPQRELEPDEERYWISPERLEALLDVARRHDGVRITFDDGNASDVDLALPALARRGLDATFFLIAGRLDEPGSVSRDGARELRRAGMRVGCHGMWHRPWPSLTPAALQEELVDARRALADASGAPVDEAACPFGAYDRSVVSALRRQGFARAYTVDGGAARPAAWLQTRHTILATDTPETIERVVGGATRRRPLQAGKRAVKRWR